MFLAARWRLTIVFTVVLVVILAASGVVVYLTTRSLIFDRVDAELAEKAERDMFLVSSNPGGGPGHRDGPNDEGAPPEFDPGGYFYAITYPNGEVIETSDNVDEGCLAKSDTLASAVEGGDAVTRTESDEGDPKRIYVTSAIDSEGNTVLLQIGRSIEPELDTLSQLRTILLAVVGISIVPALVGGYALSGRVLRPIKTAMDSQRAFIADASHELRTPVAVVRTNAELLERHIQSGTIGRSDNDATAIEDILGESERLGRMVGQMLTLAQADTGQTITSKSALDLGQLAEGVARSVRSLAEAKGIRFQTQIAQDIWVDGDADRLREVMVTLVDNAIKFTELGGAVDFEVRRDRRRARVTVADNGPGIPRESLPHVFERFYRVDRARSRDEGGTGLGLAIAREIVQAHGGSISVDSTPGAGTRFDVELRLTGKPGEAINALREPEA
jgi:two-component system, OmpR family, sensor histidine kinase CiaH